MNGRAERAASIGKLYNECLSLASMMDESGIVFVTNAIFFESLCCFPVQGKGVCCAEPARLPTLIMPLEFNDLTINSMTTEHTCVTNSSYQCV